MHLPPARPLAARTFAAALLTVALAAPAAAQRNGPLPQLFPADNWWNVDVSNAPVDPDSDAFIAFIGAAVGMHPDFGGNADDPPSIYGMPYVSVPASQPLVPVAFVDYGDESDAGFPGRPAGYPIPEEAKHQPYFIEGGHPGSVEPDGDRHLLIVDRDRRILYELYRAHWTGNRWEAGSGAIFSLDSNDRRPEGWTSADAAGLAILPGLVRRDEAFGNAPIRHAFRVTVRRTNGYVYPASHRAGDTAGALPMGARLRLKADVDLSGYPPEVRRIFQAMKTYGLVVADNGADMYVQGVYDTRWDNDVLNPAFDSITAGDFEVVRLGWRPPTGPRGGGTLRAVSRCRLLDTRAGFGPWGGPGLPPGVSRVVRGTGRCGVPASARALQVDLLVLQAPRAGALRWFAGDETGAGAPSLAFQRPRGRRNAVRMPLAASGSGAFALRSTVGVHVLVEVTGYYD